MRSSMIGDQALRAFASRFRRPLIPPGDDANEPLGSRTTAQPSTAEELRDEAIKVITRHSDELALGRFLLASRAAAQLGRS
jgi:hypothetical protein